MAISKPLTVSSVAQLRPLSLGQNDRREEHVISAARGHRTKTAVVHRRQTAVVHRRRRRRGLAPDNQR